MGETPIRFKGSREQVLTLIAVCEMINPFLCGESMINKTKLSQGCSKQFVNRFNGDYPAALYAQRCGNFIGNPPEENRDGCFRPEKK